MKCFIRGCKPVANEQCRDGESGSYNTAKMSRLSISFPVQFCRLLRASIGPLTGSQATKPLYERQHPSLKSPPYNLSNKSLPRS
ncbi:unnamed protein product [Somion occarium]|uniref:Uncharacterized protein n=1 Tax=Somion occarium TaxID=3059160 RepID=A0ABP1E025_9APHY